VPTHLKTCAAVFAALILGLAACGDDDDGADADADAGATGAGAAQPAADAGESDGDTAAYCAATLALETAPPPDVDFATASPEEIADAVKAYAADVLRPLADEVLAAAPDELGGEVEVLDSALDEMAASGDEAAFDRPATAEASRTVHAYDVETCGWATVDVTATNFAFDGLPGEQAAGVTSFELTNEGGDVHELLLLRKDDGVTQSAEELLALPEDEAMALATVVGDPAFALPGAGDHAVVDLEPGDYVAVCFIPTGTTGTDGPPPEGPPHAMNGMFAEFTVT
jgi:hypothetical protein